MVSERLFGGAVLVSVLVAPAAIPGVAQVPQAAAEIWRVVTEDSHVRIHVGKAGLFSFAGHEHDIDAPAVSGEVQLERNRLEQSSIELTFYAKALKVDPEGEPPGDVPEVQETMLGPDVLDVERYPTIRFRSTGVEVAGRSEGRLDLRVTGALTIRDVTREVTVPVEVSLSPDSLRATGTFTIKQTDYRIEPVTAGLGTVRVKDELELSLTIVARPAGGLQTSPPYDVPRH